MKIWPDCIPCIIKMSLNTARIGIKSDAKIKSFIDRLLQLDHLRGNNWDVTSPDIIQDVWFIMHQMFGTRDLLIKIKKEQNDTARKVYPVAKNYVLKSNDPLSEAVKFAIAGNSIDIMKGEAKTPTKEAIDTIQQHTLKPKDMNILRKRLQKAKKLVYISDNCGEIFFDKLLLETIKMNCSVDTTFIARSLPVLNDATVSDALSAGIDKVARVIGNGTSKPFPGTSLNKVSPIAKKCIDEADLIISKGGGNYDTLTEESTLKGKISFLFEAKCEPYCIIHKVPLGDLIIDNY
jgi:damage-control phosphatase, subfamily I